MSSSKKHGMKKPDGTREKDRHSRSSEIYPTRVNNRNSGGKSAHVPDNNLYGENTYAKFEDGEEAFYEQQSAAGKMKYADIAKGEGTKTDEFEPNLSANEDLVHLSELLAEENHYRRSTSCESPREGERSEENHSLPESDMSCESQPFDDFEGDLKEGLTLVKGDYLKSLENACISDVFDFYNICGMLNMKEQKRIGVEALKSKLSKLSVSDFDTVLDFADKNNETELRDYTLAFLSKNYLEMLNLKKWKEYVQKDPVKADPVSFPGILAEENHSSPESDMSSESTREEKRNKAWNFLMDYCLKKLENACISDVLKFYNISVKCQIIKHKIIVVESLSIKLNKSNFCTVLTFADKNNETKLQDNAVTFLSNHLLEILKSEEWKIYNCENPEKANELIIRALSAERGEERIINAG